jgi:VDE lipocalin domain
MCSTGCFAKHGSILSCSVEKNDCVHVPGKENVGWTVDTLADLPGQPISNFDASSLAGTWYKVMGLDSRYDCFDCQRNSFNVKDSKTLAMEAVFRIPRPSFPGYLQNNIMEELHKADSTTSLAQLQSKGEMFGLTFWENWYILGDAKSAKVVNGLGISSANAANNRDMKLVFYTGHTLQGSYKGMVD